MTRALASLLVFASLAGCSSVSPTVEVESVQPRSGGPDGAVVAITLRATNPGPESYPLKRLDYTVEIDGQPAFTGSRSPEATLAPNSTRTIFIPAPFSSAPAPGATYRVRGKLEFTRPGQINELLYDSGLITPTATFSGTGGL